LFTPTTTHLIVDVMGVFDDTAAIDVGNPERLFDSRSLPSMVAAGSTVRVDVGSYLSDDAAGAVLNITGLRAAAPGHFTAYPCADGLPEAANLNLVPGVVVANAAVITPDANGEICVRTHAAAHMVVDLLGEIGESFSGFRPVRVLDTRQG
jgi:hypothetical protein